jgi:hypothetical protein
MIILKLKFAIVVAIFSIVLAAFSIYSFTHNSSVLAFVQKVKSWVLVREPVTNQKSQKPLKDPSEPPQSPPPQPQHPKETTQPNKRKGSRVVHIHNEPDKKTSNKK